MRRVTLVLLVLVSLACMAGVAGAQSNGTINPLQTNGSIVWR